MEERLSTSSSRCPTAAIVACLLILMAEGWILANKHLFLDDVFPVMTEKVREMRSGNAATEIVIMGDSRFFHMDTKNTAEAFGGGRRVFNYSWPNFGVEAYLYALNAYTHYNPTPEIMIVNFTPELVATPTEYLRINKHEIVRSRAYETIPLIPHVATILETRNWHYLWLHTVARATPPSATYRRLLNQAILSIITLKGIPPREPILDRHIREFQRNGSFVLFDETTYDPEFLARFNEGLFVLDAYGDEEVLRLFQKFLHKADSLGIVVVVLNTPVPEDLVVYYQTIGGLSIFERWVEMIRSEHENLVIVDPLLPVFPNEFMADIGHVNAAGDRAFEAGLAERVAPFLPLIEERVSAMKKRRNDR